VVTVALNAADTIGDCLRSVHSQNYPVEHIVIDGGSVDGTLGRVADFGNKISKVVSEPDDGIYHAMNRGISLATGEMIGILNADDSYAHSDTLLEVAESLAASGADSCYGDLVYVDPMDVTKVVRYWHAGGFGRKKFWWGWMPPHPTFFVRREVYKRYGAFDTSLGSAADYELMVRFLIKQQITTVYVPKTLVRMRCGGVSNASLKNRILANKTDRVAWKVNSLKPFPWTLWMKPLRKVGQFLKRG
jgi:glycosyltransferase